MSLYSCQASAWPSEQWLPWHVPVQQAIVGFEGYVRSLYGIKLHGPPYILIYFDTIPDCLLPLQVFGIVLVMTCRLQTMLGTCRCTLLVPGEVPRTVWLKITELSVKPEHLQMVCSFIKPPIMSLHEIVRHILYTVMLVNVIHRPVENTSLCKVRSQYVLANN